MLVAYCSSALWLGVYTFLMPYMVIPMTPYGLITALDRLGCHIVNDQEAARFTLLAHAIFWPGLLCFLWRLPRLCRVVLYGGAFVICVIVLTTLGGCVHMPYEQ